MSISDRDARIRTVCLILLTTVVVGGAVKWLRPVLLPFVLAVFLAIALSPLVGLLVKRARFPRQVAVLAALVVGVGMLVVIGVVVSGAVASLARDSEMYQQRASELLGRALDLLPLERLGVSREQALEPLGRSAAKWGSSLLIESGSALTEILSNGALVVLFVCFLLFGTRGGILPPGSDWEKAETDVKRYIVVKAVLSAATGVLVGLALQLLGVKLAVLFGLLAFLLNFIPSVGSVLATLLPLPVVVVDPEVGTVAGVLAIALPALVQVVIGNILEPRLMGRRFGLHPIAVLMGLILWGMLWGIVGMFLATPILAVSRIFLQRHLRTRPVADLLAGRVASSA
jgi:AI-2 transport protein TqsA